jgi:hypothetical protein
MTLPQASPNITYERSSGAADWDPPRLCAKLPMVPIVRCWLPCRLDVPLTGRLKLQFAAPPNHSHISISSGKNMSVQKI